MDTVGPRTFELHLDGETGEHYVRGIGKGMYPDRGTRKVQLIEFSEYQKLQDRVGVLELEKSYHYEGVELHYRKTIDGLRNEILMLNQSHDQALKELGTARQQAAYYKSCALSGEVPNAPPG